MKSKNVTLRRVNALPAGEEGAERCSARGVLWVQITFLMLTVFGSWQN